MTGLPVPAELGKLDRELAQAIKPILSRIAPEKPPPWNIELAPSEEYATEVLRSNQEVKNSIERMRQSLALLSGYRRDRLAGAASLHRVEYINYHMESFFVNMVGVSDRALRLINTTLRLGLDPRDCAERVIMRCKQVKGTPIEAQWKSLNTEARRYATERNAVVHHSRFRDEESDLIAFITAMDAIESVSAAIPTRIKDLTRVALNDHIRELRNRYGAHPDTLAMAALGLEDALLPIAKASVQSLQ